MEEGVLSCAWTSLLSCGAELEPHQLWECGKEDEKAGRRGREWEENRRARRRWEKREGREGKGGGGAGEE